MDEQSEQTKDLAYYYSEWIWPPQSSDWMKSLLLFFDGIALALPPALAAEVIDHDPVLAPPLLERGLLKNFAPTEWLDRQAAEILATTLLDLMHRERAWWHYGTSFLNLTSEHFGAEMAPELANEFLRELRRLGLASDSSTEGLVLMHPSVRQVVLTVFVRVLESCLSRSSNVTLQPTTDRAQLQRQHVPALREYLRVGHPYGTMPYFYDPASSALAYREYPVSARVINTDLHTVGLDLSSVPLDEVLDFRREQGQHYRRYARSLRRFTTDVEYSTQREFQDALDQRQEEIRDMGADLRRRGRRAFGRKSVVAALSLAGATWTAVHGDPIGALLATGGAAAGIQGLEIPVSSYSYLFKARNIPSSRYS